jgi:hypothetical protein
LIWPPENNQLYERITENGALVTQFPFNRPVTSNPSRSATASSLALRATNPGSMADSARNRPSQETGPAKESSWPKSAFRDGE